MDKFSASWPRNDADLRRKNLDADTGSFASSRPREFTEERHGAAVLCRAAASASSPRGIRRRVISHRIENPTQVDHAGAVQLQSLHRDSPHRREPHDEDELGTPRKVLLPAIRAWMIEPHGLSARWISSSRLIVLVVVAALAGEREVIDCRRSPSDLRDDVLDRERVRRQERLAPAVLATTPGAIRDGSLQRGRNPTLTHLLVLAAPGSRADRAKHRGGSRATGPGLPGQPRVLRRPPRSRPTAAAAHRTRQT